MPTLRSVLVGTIGTFGLLCLLIGACRTNGPDTTADSTEADTAAAATAEDTSSTSPDSVDRPDPPSPAPAPGTARVRAETVSCDTATTPVHCRIRVDEVLEYGSATPPLNTGERTVALASSVLDGRDETTAIDTLGRRTFVLQHVGDQPTIGDQSGDQEAPAWTLQSIE